MGLEIERIDRVPYRRAHTPIIGSRRAGCDRWTLKRHGRKMMTSAQEMLSLMDTLSLKVNAIEGALSENKELMAGRVATNTLPMVKRLLVEMTKVSKQYEQIQEARTGWAKKEESDVTTKADLESKVEDLESKLAKVTDLAIDRFMRDWNRGKQSDMNQEMNRLGGMEAYVWVLQKITSVHSGDRKKLFLEITRWIRTGVGPTIQVKVKEETDGDPDQG